MTLPDVLAEGLAVVFCGAASGGRSDREQAYYSGRRNKFWATLYRTQLTPRQMRPEEYMQVLAHDIGLTDLSKTRSGGELEMDDADFDIGDLKERIAENKPALVAFNGKGAAAAALGKERVDYGRQAEKIAGAAVYVLPSTSEKAKDHWNEKYWMELAAEVKKIRRGVKK